MKRAVVFSLLFLVAAHGIAAEKWWEPYKRGTLAAQSNDWSTVANEMNRAIALKPAEELAAKARNEILVYVPHFWLGIAKFQLGDVDAALTEWQISQNQNVIQRTQYYADLQKWLARAQSHKAKKASESSAGVRAEADAELSKAVGGQVDAISSGADRSETFRSAKRKLDEAWELYNKAGNDQKIYKQAAAAASEAYDLFVAAAKEAATKKAAAKQIPRPQPVVQKAVQKSSPPAVVTTSTQPPAQQTHAQVAPPVKIPEPAKVAEAKPELVVESAALVNLRVDLQQLRRRLLDAKRNDERLEAFVAQGLTWADGWEQELKPALADDKIGEIRDRVVSVDTELDKRIAALKAEDAKKAKEIAAAAEKSGPLSQDALKKEIRSAYISYAKGDLAASETLLDTIVASKTKSAEALLLRGAAKYTRAALSRQKELYAEAEKDFIAALKLNPAAGLDPSHFSPKLINFFHDVRKKQAGVR